MASISALRNGLATNIRTIPNLRVAVTIPDDPQPPQAVIALNTVAYNRAMHNGLAEYSFTVSVVYARQSERSAQNSLDVLSAPSGVGSFKAACESDRTLGGVAADVRVTDMTGFNVVSIGEVNYLSADFSVTVFAN